MSGYRLQRSYRTASRRQRLSLPRRLCSQRLIAGLPFSHIGQRIAHPLHFNHTNIGRLYARFTPAALHQLRMNLNVRRSN
nr:hypothetical protein [Xenorhabdus bovienii]